MLYFTANCWAKLRLLLSLAQTKLNNYEIHGMGAVTVVDSGMVLCDDIDMPEQEASSAHITSASEQIATWRAERFALKKGMTDVEIEIANAETQRWRLWWHSHNSMTASYSTTDYDTLRDLSEEAGWMLGLVVNNKFETESYIAYRDPLAFTVKIGEIALWAPPSVELEAEADLLIERVTKKSYPVAMTTGYKAYFPGNGTSSAERDCPLCDKPLALCTCDIGRVTMEVCHKCLDYMQKVNGIDVCCGCWVVQELCQCTPLGDDDASSVEGRVMGIW